MLPIFLIRESESPSKSVLLFDLASFVSDGPPPPPLPPPPAFAPPALDDAEPPAPPPGGGGRPESAELPPGVPP